MSPALGNSQSIWRDGYASSWLQFYVVSSRTVKNRDSLEEKSPDWVDQVKGRFHRRIDFGVVF